MARHRIQDPDALRTLARRLGLWADLQGWQARGTRGVHRHDRWVLGCNGLCLFAFEHDTLDQALEHYLVLMARLRGQPVPRLRVIREAPEG